MIEALPELRPCYDRLVADWGNLGGQLLHGIDCDAPEPIDYFETADGEAARARELTLLGPIMQVRGPWRITFSLPPRCAGSRRALTTARRRADTVPCLLTDKKSARPAAERWLSPDARGRCLTGYGPFQREPAHGRCASRTQTRSFQLGDDLYQDPGAERSEDRPTQTPVRK